MLKPKSILLACMFVSIPLWFVFPAAAEQLPVQGSLQSDQESALWAEVQKGNSPDDYEAYLAQYPNGRFAVLAKSRAAKLREQASVDQARQDQVAWDKASSMATESGYQAYLLNFPNGRYSVLAQARISKIRKEKAEAAFKSLRPGDVFRDCPDCPDMVLIPAGNVKMGQARAETGRKRVEFPGPAIGGMGLLLSSIEPKPETRSSEQYAFVASIGTFAIGRIEVTQGQWRAIMGYNPSEFRDCGDNCPVESVSWYEAKEFIQKLNKKTGKQYRLPSEQEWEYACRAGGQQEYCGGDSVGDIAWYRGNADSKIHAGAAKRANAWGLYDLSGNVWEWVEDGWHANYNGAPVDGSAWAADNSEHVLRGGSWFSESQDMRATRRFGFDYLGRSNNIGFRIARNFP